MIQQHMILLATLCILINLPSGFETMNLGYPVVHNALYISRGVRL